VTLGQSLPVIRTTRSSEPSFPSSAADVSQTWPRKKTPQELQGSRAQ